jgi:UDP-N-acetylmuramoylalanine--D-glutamate ligase
MDEYALAKQAIFNGQGVQVLNRDDHYSMAMRQSNRTVVTFGLDAHMQDYGLAVGPTGISMLQGHVPLLNMQETKLAGLHNATNVLAAIACCRAIDLPMLPLLNAVKTFKGLPHRVEWVAQINQVDFYDDSKGTNVGATCAAIAGMQQKVVLIAGGDGKGQDFSPLKQPVESNGRAVVLIGRDANLIEQALLPTDVALYRAFDMAEAVAIALKVAHQGDAVLLSPACASFDMYKNYVHRAEVFVQAVQALAIHAQQNNSGAGAREVRV